MAFFPFSFMLAQFRPDAVLFALSAAALVLAQTERPLAAGVAALVGGFSKPNAFLLAAPLARYAFAPDSLKPGKATLRTLVSRLDWKVLWMLAAPGVGIVVFALYLRHHTGEALAFAKIQAAWGGAFLVRPWSEAVELVQHPHLVDRGGWNPALLNWAVLVAIIGATIALWRQNLRIFAIYIATVAGVTFLNQGTITLGKHISECPPFFLGLAFLLNSRGSRTLEPLAAGLLAVIGFCNGAGLFFTMF